MNSSASIVVTRRNILSRQDIRFTWFGFALILSAFPIPASPKPIHSGSTSTLLMSALRRSSSTAMINA